VYLHPVHDTLDFLARSRYRDSKHKGKEYEDFIETAIDEMKIKYNITAMTGLGMRGRTFSNTIAIIDEAQNMSKSSLQKVLTRFGKDCKIIIVGSNRQIDNPYVTKYTNGLSVILEACTKPQEKIQLHAVPLTKVVRSDLAEFAEKVFSK
jgi:PhoH-like ATPase